MTIASFAISAGWTAGSGPIFSQRAEPPTTMAERPGLGQDEDEDEQHDGEDVDRHGDQPEVAVVDPHHRRHRGDAERRPADLRSDDAQVSSSSR